MSWPTLGSAAIAALEAAINKALAYDPATLAKISELGEPLVIDCLQPKLSVSVTGSAKGVLISRGEHVGATRLTGTATALLSLANKPQSSLANSGVTVSGNLDLLQRWQSALRDIEIDWQGLVSEFIGESLGSLISSVATNTFQYSKERSRDMMTFVSHYFSDERRWVPHPVELERFYDEVDQLALACDRLAARINEQSS